MGDDIDISGDGGVRKKILRKAKDGAAGPSSAEPLVDGETVIASLELAECGPAKCIQRVY